MTTPEQSLDVIDKGMAPLKVVRRWTAGSLRTTYVAGQIGRDLLNYQRVNYTLYYVAQ